LLKISVECPHCRVLTYLDSMSEAQFAISEPALRSILHAVKCSQCGSHMGKHGGRLHKDMEA